MRGAGCTTAIFPCSDGAILVVEATLKYIQLFKFVWMTVHRRESARVDLHQKCFLAARNVLEQGFYPKALLLMAPDQLTPVKTGPTPL